MIKNIHDLKIGQVFVTKKGHKMEITDVRKDFANGFTEQEIYDNLNEDEKKDFQWGMGSVEVKTFSHSESQNCKSYGCKHNTKWFKGYVRLDGFKGFLKKLEKGWTLKK